MVAKYSDFYHESWIKLSPSEFYSIVVNKGGYTDTIYTNIGDNSFYFTSTEKASLLFINKKDDSYEILTKDDLDCYFRVILRRDKLNKIKEKIK